MTDPVDQLQYGHISPLVKRVSADITQACTMWAVNERLLPGTIGHIVLEAAYILSWVNSIQNRLGLEPTQGDVKEIIEHALKVVRRHETLDLPDIGGSSGCSNN